jgi:drug/metabolite transporter (DMT)-like permease
MFRLGEAGDRSLKGARPAATGSAAGMTGGTALDLLIVLGLGIAVLSALTTDIGFLMRHRGAGEAPDVDIRKPVRTVVGLFSKKWWSIGFAFAALAWLLHVASLKLAPLSLVQAVLASGFVLLGIVAERFFGFKVGRREWLGIGLTTLGLALLGITASQAESNGSSADYPLEAAIAFEGGLIVAGAVALLWHRKPDSRGHSGALLGAAAGLLFTVSHVGIKALTAELSFTDPATFLTPWAPVVLGAFVGAFFASARSLQVGEAVPVIAITSAVSNVSAILAGIVVFRDPIGDSPFIIAVRIAAFALVIIAAALIPAPVRAGGQRQESGPKRSGAPVPAEG